MIDNSTIKLYFRRWNVQTRVSNFSNALTLSNTIGPNKIPARGVFLWEVWEPTIRACPREQREREVEESCEVQEFIEEIH